MQTLSTARLAPHAHRAAFATAVVSAAQPWGLPLEVAWEDGFGPLLNAQAQATAQGKQIAPPAQVRPNADGVQKVAAAPRALPLVPAQEVAPDGIGFQPNAGAMTPARGGWGAGHAPLSPSVAFAIQMAAAGRGAQAAPPQALVPTGILPPQIAHAHPSAGHVEKTQNAARAFLAEAE
ncbi:MAG: hypothetical protein NZM37_03790 [Sandaracinaceae bacterium]|nr:hypothetical protein [Sandaracinaceae bacterium]